MVSAQGFEPRTHALEGRCSIQLSYAPILLERETRFELATSTLARLRSTTELFPHINLYKNGGTNRARTCDPLLVRQVLSQLSYGPTIIKNGAGEGDRTLTAGLEGRNSTIELHPHGDS